MEAFSFTVGPRKLPGTKDIITAEVRFTSIAGQDPSFCITGTVYGREPVRGEKSITHDGVRYWPHSGGRCDEDIAKAFPKLAPFQRFNLADARGPMHYEANALYWAEKLHGCSEWPTRSYDPDPRAALASTVCLRDGEDLPAVITTDDDGEPLSDFAMRAEVRRVYVPWLRGRIGELRADFVAAMETLRAMGPA